MQQEQFQHDKRNHTDILYLHKNDRLKHYGLHFCKYVGRLARGSTESKPVERTVVDCVLVSLSAANTLHQRLPAPAERDGRSITRNDTLAVVADAAGRFADACEKIDHQEEFLAQARAANSDIFAWALSCSFNDDFDITKEILKRRQELAERQFFIRD
ncbi:hypothetical protein [Methylorubrum populi]|uniref:hypothetical protein n=1 Tax=Methylorubrum populi TaxID=223967 RepID=UPI001264987B|nr:hypothetical protein [Methylorubrum populi]